MIELDTIYVIIDKVTNSKGKQIIYNNIKFLYYVLFFITASTTSIFDDLPRIVNERNIKLP